MKQNKILEALTAFPPAPKTYQYIHAAETDFFLKGMLLPPKWDAPINTNAKGGEQAGAKTAVKIRSVACSPGSAPTHLTSHPSPTFFLSSILCGPSHTELTTCSFSKIGHAVSFLLPC